MSVGTEIRSAEAGTAAGEDNIRRGQLHISPKQCLRNTQPCKKSFPGNGTLNDKAPKYKLDFSQCCSKPIKYEVSSCIWFCVVWLLLTMSSVDCAQEPLQLTAYHKRDIDHFINKVLH